MNIYFIVDMYYIVYDSYFNLKFNIYVLVAFLNIEKILIFITRLWIFYAFFDSVKMYKTHMYVHVKYPE